MKCPVCETVDLVMADRQGVEIDYCPRCRGVWLDRGELDKIIERSATAENAIRKDQRDIDKRDIDKRKNEVYDYDDDDYKREYGRMERREHDPKYYKKKSVLSEIFDIFD